MFFLCGILSFNPVFHLRTRMRSMESFLCIPFIFPIRCCQSRASFSIKFSMKPIRSDQTECLAGLTQASVVGEQLHESLAVGLAVAAAAAVAPRRQAEASRPHVVGRHHCTCRAQDGESLRRRRWRRRLSRFKQSWWSSVCLLSSV